MNKIRLGLYVVVTLILSFVYAGPTARAQTLPGDVLVGYDLHAPPFNYLFGNHIDTHQRTRLKTSRGAPRLVGGFLYIVYRETGDHNSAVVDPANAGIDPSSGLPFASHPRGPGEHSEECGVDIDCYVGWIMVGDPGDSGAKFLYHSGVNGDDHPVWMVNRGEESSSDVSAIPQPGSFTHFHWITQTSTDPRAGGVSDDCNKQNAGQLETAEPTAVNDICQGWFLQIRAARDFAFLHGGETIPVRQGIDNRSHLNLVTNYEDVPGITGTR